MELATIGLRIGGMPMKAQCGFLCLLPCALLYVTVATQKFGFGGLEVGKDLWTTTTGETVQNHGD